MRLLKFLNEELDRDETVKRLYTTLQSTIIKDCQPFLKEKVVLYKGAKFISGSAPDTGISLSKFDVPAYRPPRDAPLRLDKFVNSWLENNGYVRRDKSVICTGDKRFAATFGPVHMLFPIGNFKYSYCQTKDFLVHGNDYLFTIKDFYFLYNSQPNIPDNEKFRKRGGVEYGKDYTASPKAIEHLLRTVIHSKNLKNAVING